MAGRVVWSPQAVSQLESICDYRIVYRISASTIEVAAICHGARQLERALPKSP